MDASAVFEQIRNTSKANYARYGILYIRLGEPVIDYLTSNKLDFYHTCPECNTKYFMHTGGCDLREIVEMAAQSEEEERKEIEGIVNNPDPENTYPTTFFTCQEFIDFSGIINREPNEKEIISIIQFKIKNDSNFLEVDEEDFDDDDCLETDEAQLIRLTGSVMDFEHFKIKVLSYYTFNTGTNIPATRNILNIFYVRYVFTQKDGVWDISKLESDTGEHIYF